MNRLWQFTEFPFQPEKLLYYETIFTIGNGYLGTRASFEEGCDGDTPATLVHGIYDHTPGMLVPELVNLPNWLDFKITVDGTPIRMVNINNTELHPKDGALLGYRRTLHLDKALLRREILFRAQSGSIVRVTFERFASLHNVHLVAQRIEFVVVDGNPQIIVDSGIEGDVHNNGARHWLPDMQVLATDHLVTLEARTQQSGYGLGMASTLISPYVVKSDVAALRPHSITSFTLKPEQSVTLDKLTTIYTTRDGITPLTAAQTDLHEAIQTGYDSLRSQHEAAWEQVWADSDIQIDGDENLQRSIRFTQYHLLIAAPRHSDDVSVGAKTLSGFGYKGHVFWDTELFILPPLTVMQPKLARNLMMYRYHRLPGARHKAKANGYEGAMYPWESTDTGEETTPQWGDPQPDGTRIRIWTGDSEQHISSDIAYGIDQYWWWTGDDEFIRLYGAEIILDTAVFWGSRVEEKDGRYEISRQIGGDEYHENVDNSVFTNRMVAWHLQKALDVLVWLHRNCPDDAERLVAALDLNAERLARWRDIIDRLYIPFDQEKQIHIQFPGFFDMEYIPVPHYEPRTVSVQAILGHHRTTQTQVIKQADVIMLMALLGEKLGSPEVLLNNWNTYYPRTDHGSSLSPSIHAWVAANLGLDDEAAHLLEHAAGIDLNDNKGNVRDGIHGAACGGLWQAIVFGFCGLHIDINKQLAVNPRLPSHWRSVSFSVYYRGQKRQFTVQNPAMVSPAT